MRGREIVKIIAVDNGSTDGSQAFVKEQILGEGDLFVQNEENLGHAGSTQKALDMVDTPYCVYLNCDDYHGPEYIIRSVEHLENHPETSITFGHSYIFPYLKSDEDRLEKGGLNKRANCFPVCGLYKGSLLKALASNVPVDAGLLVRVSAVKAIGGFQNDAWSFLVQHNTNICFLNVDHLYSGKHPRQESKRYVQGAILHQAFARAFWHASGMLSESLAQFTVNEVLYAARVLGITPIAALNSRIKAARTAHFLRYSTDPDLERQIVYTMLDVLCTTIGIEPEGGPGSQGRYLVSNMGMLPLGAEPVNERLAGFWELAKAYKVLPEDKLVSAVAMLQHFKTKDLLSAG